MPLFKGRDDMYAKRWERRDGGFGYSLGDYPEEKAEPLLIPP
jgi:hypothetical protein